jgi:hypothetical protein
MDEQFKHEAQKATDRPFTFKNIAFFLMIVFLGPAFGVLLDGYNIVLAPPNTGLTFFFYLLFPVFGVLVGIAAVLLRLIGWRTLLVSMVALSFFGCGYLSEVAGSNMPSFLDTQCEVVDATPPSVQYECTTFSETTPFFTVEGRSGWPLMRSSEFRRRR